MAVPNRGRHALDQIGWGEGPGGVVHKDDLE